MYRLIQKSQDLSVLNITNDTFLRWILIKCLLHVFAVSYSKVDSFAVSKSSKKASSLKHVILHSEGLWGALDMWAS